MVDGEPKRKKVDENVKEKQKKRKQRKKAKHIFKN